MVKLAKGRGGLMTVPVCNAGNACRLAKKTLATHAPTMPAITAISMNSLYEVFGGLADIVASRQIQRALLHLCLYDSLVFNQALSQ
jgi:hypothetical protein